MDPNARRSARMDRVCEYLAQAPVKSIAVVQQHKLNAFRLWKLGAREFREGRKGLVTMPLNDEAIDF